METVLFLFFKMSDEAKKSVMTSTEPVLYFYKILYKLIALSNNKAVTVRYG